MLWPGVDVFGIVQPPGPVPQIQKSGLHRQHRGATLTSGSRAISRGAARLLWRQLPSGSWTQGTGGAVWCVLLDRAVRDASRWPGSPRVHKHHQSLRSRRMAWRRLRRVGAHVARPTAAWPTKSMGIGARIVAVQLPRLCQERAAQPSLRHQGVEPAPAHPDAALPEGTRRTPWKVAGTPDQTRLAGAGGRMWP